MFWKSTSVKTRIGIGTAFLASITLLMGLIGLYGFRSLATTTKNMYEHPLTVGQSVRDICSQVYAMHRNMKDVVLAESSIQLDDLRVVVDQQEAQALLKFDIIAIGFLGELKTVDQAQKIFVDWKPIRDHVFELMELGNVDAAVAITKGGGAAHVELIHSANKEMSDFASQKALEFYNEAKASNRRLVIHLLILMILMLVFALLVAWAFGRTLVSSLNDLRASMSRFALGDFSERVLTERKDEIGEVAKAFNQMADDLNRTTTSVDRLNKEIEERRLAETAQAALGRIIEDSVNEVFLFRQTDLKFVLVNRGGRENLGYSMEEFQEMTPLDIKPEFTSAKFKELIKPLDEAPGKSVKFETIHQRNDGSTYLVDVNLNAGMLGDLPVFVALILDISERKKSEQERQSLEAQVQHAQKLESLGVLAGGIAHDFNNILMSVLGNASLALEDISPASPAREGIVNIETAAKRAADLCRQMLAYSGKGRFMAQPLDLGELVVEMGQILEVSISKKAVLRYELAPNLPAIKADATQIRQVLLNLITNASEAIGDKSGIISIRTGAMACDSRYFQDTYIDDKLDDGMYVYIEVGDTGSGMSAETKSKIFEPFFSTKFTGRGLGLAAVLGIIRGHKGALKVYSELDKGTSFKVLFPASEELASTMNLESSDEICIDSSGAILLVDDEETVRALGKNILTRLGFDVILAEDGKMGVEMYTKHRDEIRCVILDLTMPHMGGEEAFRKIRGIDPEALIILSSGYNAQEVTQRFAGKGLSGFLQKPYLPSDLARTLNTILKHSPAPNPSPVE
jgi:PAS domain S-box-containing protein